MQEFIDFDSRARRFITYGSARLDYLFIHCAPSRVERDFAASSSRPLRRCCSSLFCLTSSVWMELILSRTLAKWIQNAASMHKQIHTPETHQLSVTAQRPAFCRYIISPQASTWLKTILCIYLAHQRQRGSAV